MGLAQLCLRRSEIFLSWYFACPKFFSCGYFEDPKLFLVSILWVQNVVAVFPGFEIFSRGYFVGPKFFLAGISRVRNFISFVFLESKIFYSGCFMGPRFFFSRGYFEVLEFFLVTSLFLI